MITNGYGLEWPKDSTQLQVEMSMIRRGGMWSNGDEVFGKGLFYHYKQLQIELWGESEDHHRWTDLMLQTILDNRLTVIQGSKDSGKTHVALSRFALTDYFLYPQETLILVSSTDSRGLEMRVWGDIKSLFERAKARHPSLAGNVIDAKKGLFTDGLDSNNEVRDMRKGIIGIPCLGTKGEWVGGLEKYYGIKQKRRRLLADECFPAGTMVDTPSGPTPIETIKAGDIVISAAGENVVSATRCSLSDSLVRIHCKDGRKIVCTPNHPFFTQMGWVLACHLCEQHYMMSANETMRILQQGLPAKEPEGQVLFTLLFIETHSQPTRNKGILFWGAQGGTPKETRMGEGAIVAHGEEQPNAQPGQLPEGCCWDTGVGCVSESSGRERDRTIQSGVAINEDVPRGNLESSNQDGQKSRKWLPNVLQSGFRISENQAGNRSRWSKSQQPDTQSEGSKEGSPVEGSWVASVEVLEQTDSGFSDSGFNLGRCRVYNLQVEGHPSYSVEGLISHNCQFMKPPFMGALANLDKGDFKCVAVGNPIGQGDPLDKMAEPVEGWDSLGEVTKTRVWKNKFSGVTINLVGTDSPNFDKDTKDKYHYLLNADDVQRVKERYGPDSMEFWSQIMGVRKAGLDARRVLTRILCERNDAFKSATWDGTDTLTKIYALDAAFGGDRCIGGMIEFGREVNGQVVIRVDVPKEYQIAISSQETPEEQIARQSKADIDALGIPSAHYYFDAGMRATLATELSKVLGNDVNAVNFQGNATARPVSSEDFVFDEKTQSKRPKRCDEHYSKFVTELWFSVRYAVLSRQIRELPQEVAEEFYMREWIKVKGDRYEIESKADMKERVGYSPDKADWLSIAVEGARRQGFMVERLRVEGTVKSEMDDWLEKEMASHKKFMKKTELNYS